MLSIPQIRHLVDARAYERLIDRVLTSGRSGNLSVRLRLGAPQAQPPAALGLALQRVVELTYGPTPLAADLATRIIHLQRADGLFGGEAAESDAPPESGDRHTLTSTPEGDRPVGSVGGVSGSFAFPGGSRASAAASGAEPVSPAATAAALRGLIEHRRQRVESGAAPDPVVEASIDRALFALAQRQQWNGLIGEDAVEGAIVLWQLGGVPRFRQAVRFADLCEAVDTVGEGVVTHELARLAHAMAA
ncbi:MAG: hypothetical protein HRU76_07975 [Phycisphaeraceae bacterium]|nr:MAG: hypothetical protein HRU76_07975 [Phycisphaeraceae bacterium]